MDTTLKSHDISTAGELLNNTKKSVLLYLHGVACNRALPVATYNVLRQFFLIIAVDHRGKRPNLMYSFLNIETVDIIMNEFRLIKQLFVNKLQ